MPVPRKDKRIPNTFVVVAWKSEKDRAPATVKQISFAVPVTDVERGELYVVESTELYVRIGPREPAIIKFTQNVKDPTCANELRFEISDVTSDRKKARGRAVRELK